MVREMSIRVERGLGDISIKVIIVTFLQLEIKHDNGHFNSFSRFLLLTVFSFGAENEFVVVGFSAENRTLDLS